MTTAQTPQGSVTARPPDDKPGAAEPLVNNDVGVTVAGQGYNAQ
ncbi:MAG: hypothetical protein ACHQTF_05805 [Gemmatimonadales bacterium]